MEKKLTRREQEKLRHRRQMMTAALDLFAEKGYYNVSMHEIAKQAEFATGTLYKFFKNKEDLYRALMMEHVSVYYHILSKVLTSDKDTLTVIREYIAAKAQIYTDNIATLRLYFAETRGAGYNIKSGLDKEIQNMRSKLIQQLVAVLETGIRRKVLRKMNSQHMATALEGMTNDFLLCWMEDREQHPYNANIEAITDLFFKGILSR